MAHDHDHGAPIVRDLTPAFKWAVALNAGYVLIEAAAGLVSGLSHCLPMRPTI